MGFASIASAVASAFKAYGDYQQSGLYKAQATATAQVGNAQAKLMERNAAANDAIALQNNRIQRKNAQSELAGVRADNVASNLVADGTGLERETDMASRLEREINIQTNDALRQSHNLRTQAAYTRWDADLQSSLLRKRAHSSKISSLGNLAGAMMTLGGGVYDWQKTAASSNTSSGGTAASSKK